MKPKTKKTKPKASSPATLKWSGWTDIGKVRKNNEDAFLGLRFDAHEVHRLGKFGEAATEKHDFTFAVCDGMGGAKAGEYASEIAVDKITTARLSQFRPRTWCRHRRCAGGALRADSPLAGLSRQLV